MFHLFDSLKRRKKGVEGKKEQGRRTRWTGRKGKAEINRSCAGGGPRRGPWPMSCPEGSGSDSVVLLVGLGLKKDESHFEKEGCVALLGSGRGHCAMLHSHWCVQSSTRSPPAFRGSPSAAHPPRGAEPRAEGASPALRTLAGHFGLHVIGLL